MHRRDGTAWRRLTISIAFLVRSSWCGAMNLPQGYSKSRLDGTIMCLGSLPQRRTECRIHGSHLMPHARGHVPEQWGMHLHHGSAAVQAWSRLYYRIHPNGQDWGRCSSPPGGPTATGPLQEGVRALAPLVCSGPPRQASGSAVLAR